MIKKLSVLSAILLLAGCHTLGNTGTPKVFYKLSDEDAKKWIVEVNKKEQCLFPKEYKSNSFHNLSNEERQFYFDRVTIGTLTPIIGEQNIREILGSPNAQQNLKEQFQKFNHSQTIAFDPKECEIERQELKQLRQKIAKRKVEDLAKQKELERQQKIQETEKIAKQKEAERRKKAEEDFYATKEGQAYLAQQRLMKQQQEFYKQQMESQKQVIDAIRRSAPAPDPYGPAIRPFGPSRSSTLCTFGYCTTTGY